MGAEAVTESVFSITGYMKDNYNLLIMLFGVFVVFFSARRSAMPRAEKLLPLIALGVFLCSIFDYLERYYASLETYHFQRSIFRFSRSELYSLLLFVIITRLAPARKWKIVAIPIVITTIYNIIMLFNTEWTVHFTEDNQLLRGYLGYTPFTMDLIYLGFLLYYSQKNFRGNRLFRRNLFLFITITLALTGIMVILGIDLEINTICIFYILLYMLYYTITQQANTRRELMMADMQLYQRQIGPHFIYNGLGVIRSLLPREESEAKDVLDHFTRYLRGNAELLTSTDLIPLYRELDIIDNYLYMAEKRFEDSITYEKDLRDTDFRVPAFSVQILVENAVRHGIRRREDGRGTLWISCYTSKKYNTIVVRDNGVGFDVKELVESWEDESRDGGVDWHELRKKDPDSSHLGLINLRKRLEIQCGGRLTIKSVIGKGTIARITIPIRYDKDRQRERMK